MAPLAFFGMSMLTAAVGAELPAGVEEVEAVVRDEASPSDKVGGILLGFLGAGVVLIVLGALFLMRKALIGIFNVLLILLGVGLVIAAVFGKPLGIYDRIFAAVEASESEQEGEQAGNGGGEEDRIEDIEEAPEAQ